MKNRDDNNKTSSYPLPPGGPDFDTPFGGLLAGRQLGGPVASIQTHGDFIPYLPLLRPIDFVGLVLGFGNHAKNETSK